MTDAILRQPAYQVLRRALVENVAPLVIVTGSGLSTAAGLPDWAGLRKLMQQKLDDLSYSNRNDGIPFDSGVHDAAHQATDYWLFFKLAKKALSPATFREILREALTPPTLALPPTYQALLELRPRGIVTLNLDRLSAVAVALTHPGVPIASIHGTEIAKKWRLITDEHPFLVYLHGTIEDSNTWVLDTDELKTLTSMQGHSLFLSYLYLQYTVLFVGVSADDIALSKALVTLNKSGFEPSRLFWLTNRNDGGIASWSAANNVQLIRYSASLASEHERVIRDIVTDIKAFSSVDPKRPAPIPTNVKKYPTLVSTISPEEIAGLAPEVVRMTLSSLLSGRLGASVPSALYETFMSFVEEFDYPIQTRAFYRGKSSGNEKFFGYTLTFPPMGIGNFGTVYQASSANGEPVAVKIMHNGILTNEEMLGGFRRGSASMKILTDAKVNGVVPLIESFEMPPTIVMGFVNGNSAAELFDQLAKCPWHVRARMLNDIAEIVDRCHKLPDFVLHRDLKPSNIMIEGLDFYDYTYERLVVLDFDMSWHKGSSEKDVIFESRDDFGYLAPEQTDPTKISHSRSTKVYSYGLGMTAYSFFGGLHPIANMPLDPRWYDQVLKAAKTGYKGDWLSLPFRLARLIFDATKFDQSERLEFSSGKLRFEKLARVAGAQKQEAPRDMIAEELLAIVAQGVSYTWDDLSDRGTVKFAGGAGFEVEASLDRSSIDFKVTYDDVGSRNYSNRNALVLECRDYFFKLIESGGLKDRGLTFSAGQFRFMGSAVCEPRLENVRVLADLIAGGVKILLKI